MNRKISRITLLIPIIAILIFIGISIIGSVNSYMLHTTNDSCTEDHSTESPLENSLYKVSAVEACYCPITLETYADEEPPTIVVISPPNGSLILTNTTIIIESSDNFPAMEGGVPYVPKFLYYHWNDAATNVTAYNTTRDGAPTGEGDDPPVRLELSLPSDEANVTHVLYVYAIDYENNWASLMFVFSTPEAGEESSVVWTTTTTTTTVLPRRTDGFLLIPMVFILIGTVNYISWKRRKKG